MTTDRVLIFSKRRLEALPIPEKGRMEYRDSKTPGLTLRMTSTGRRSFCLYRKVQGKPIRLTIGGFPETTVAQARQAVSEAMQEVRSGRDPREAKRKGRSALTLSDAFDFYMEHHAKPRTRKRSWQESQGQFDRYLRKRWGHRKIDTIRKADVAVLHVKIGKENGIYAANRLKALLHTMFAVWIDAELFDGPNPASGIRKFAEQSRDRFLDAGELKRFFAALAEEPNEVIRDYLLLSLLIGARRSSMLTMQWRDIDIGRAVWRIPTTKTGDPLTVPLSDPAMQTLHRRREATPEDCLWVFPSTGNRRSQSGHLSDATVVFKVVLKRAELEDVRLHDLRRTMASWQALLGSSLPVIGRSLGHTRPETTAIYARLRDDGVRESVEQANAAMIDAGGDVLFLEAENNDQET